MPSNRRIRGRACVRRFLASSLALVIAISLALTLAPSASADTFYTIKAGDTLWEIAERYGTTVETLQAINNIPSANDVQIGQVIRIPDGSASSSPAVNAGINTSGGNASDPVVYTIRDGDTAYEIAEQLGVDLQDLRDLNPGTNLGQLGIGQTILVPRAGSSSGTGLNAGPSQAEAPETSAYVVQPDDTGYEIAARHGISLDELRRLNPRVNLGVIHPGDTLFVPGASAGTNDTPVSTTSPNVPQAVAYTVQDGETASGIAAAHGISLDELRRHNPGVDLNVIHPGQRLDVPVPAYNVPALDPSESGTLLTSEYVVRFGDTGNDIADLYGISLQRLRNLNPGVNLNYIIVGQAIQVPWRGNSVYAPGMAPAVTARYRTHTVERDQTFLSIANAYGLTREQLRDFNPGRGTYLIVIGERLKLGGEIDPPVVAESVTVDSADLVQYTAARYGVTPHTLLGNNGWLGADDWVHVGAVLRIPFREGLLVTVQAGDTLRDIADAHGVDMDAILADPAYGVDDPNMIVIGQEIILPLGTPSFAWPTNSLIQLTDPFGLCRNWDCSYRHRGLDMAIDPWEPILAAADGLVVFVGGDPTSGLGWYIEIEHPNGWRTVYAHLSEFAVYQGQLVKQGEVIGYNGTTGESTGPHLHFEVRHNDWYVDPAVVLPPL